MRTRILLYLFAGAAAYGCPFCHSTTGEQVRAGIFNANFAPNLIALLAPFPVFAAVVAWMYFAPPGRGSELCPRTSGLWSPAEP
ncbi:MAG TPA: hypothetical protein VG345_13250 [Bryobacteraceae bacterium]|jgi:hypothetical protein|nr:hypothetical protein [Bryobacteraceae bacterium]